MLAQYMSARVWAGPKGAQVQRGHVTISQSGDTTIIHASNNSIINFASFNISAGENVEIIEPSARSRVLERIIGGGPTLIDGSLTSNGQLFIVNPGGINFGADAHVNVGGLTAVAGQLSNSDFLAGVNHFTNLSGPVSNQGQIVSGGPTVFAGAQVSNSGNISAGAGTVVLAAGNDVYVGNHGSDIYAKVTGGSSSLAGNVAGSGDIYSLALAHTSHVQARQIVVNGGSGNVQVSGALDASSSTGAGGSVAVTGGNVQLSGAAVNASGATGGGSINIGGDAHGAGSLQNAGQTTISADTVLSADATVAGNGGNVVVWSDHLTNFNGLITTRGAGSSGFGGNVEVSSGATLNFNGYADRTGPAGDGVLLLDPATITIDAPTAATIITNLGGGPVLEQATTEIFVTTSFDISAKPNTLTLDAPTIDLAGAITDVPGQLVGGSTVATVDLHAGGLVQNAVDVSPSVGGLINIDGGFTSSENVSIGKQITIVNLGGNGAGTADTAGSWTASQPVTLSGAFATTGHGAFNFNSSTVLSGDVLLSAPGGGQIKFGGSLTGAHNLELNSGGASEQFGGTTSVTSIKVDASGGTTTIGGNVTTTAGQTYGDAVTLSGPAVTVTDSAGIITFSSSITGAGTALTASAVGGNVFDGSVNVKSLSESGGGGATLGGNVTTTGGQTYADAVTLSGAARTFTDATGAITFSSTVSGTGTALTAGGAGAHTFDGKINVKSFSASGGALTIGADVTTSAGQTYADALTLTGTTQTFSDSAGAITFSSTITGTGTALTTSGTGGNIFDGAVNVKSLNELGGTGATLAGNITTSAGQTYADAVTLSGAARTVTDSVGAITFSSTITGGATALTASAAGGNFFDSSVTVKSLSVTGAGGTTLGGNVSTTAGQTYGDAVTLSGAAITVADTGGTITFSNTVTGAGTALTASGAKGNIFDGKTIVQSLSTTGLGGTTLAADVTTTAGQTYGDALTLTGATQNLSDSVGEIIFTSTVTGTGTNLTAGGAGGNFFDSTVKVKSLLASGAGGTTVTGNVTTTAGQTYADAVTLVSPTQTFTDATGAITFSSTVTGTSTTLTSAGAGGNIFDGKVTVLSLIANGAGGTTLGADVTTTAGQTYADAVTLTGATQTLADSVGAITFSSTITGTGTALTTSGAGGNIFDGAVNVQSLNELGGTGATLAGNVTTTNGQTYADAVTLTGAARTVTDSAGAITFDSSVTGTGTAFTASGTGGNFFDSTVKVKSLLATGAGGTTVGGNVTTTAGQTYADAVTLVSPAQTFTDATGAITFSSTVTGTSTALTSSGTGGNIFDGKLNVLSVSTIGPGGTTLGADVTTTAGQTYADAVTLTGATQTLTDSVGAITFSSTLTGTGTALTASGAGGNFFDSTVKLLSVVADGAGTTTLGGNVTTTAGQTYVDAVTLSGNAITVTDNAGVITFSSTVTGAGTALTASGAGGNTFDGLVTVKSLLASGAGGTTLNNDVTTSAGQTYADAVTLSGATRALTDTAGAIIFSSTVNGTGTALTASGAGGNIFDGKVTVLSLDTIGAAGTTLGADVSTTAGQTYMDAVSLTGSSVTLADTASLVTFSSTVTGAGTALTASGAAGNFFDSTVKVKSLLASGAGGTTLGGNVTTTAGQTYADAVTLSGSTITVTDTTGAITFSSTVNGTGTALTASGTGGNVFDSTIIVQSLSTTGAGGTTLGADVTTTAGQTYADAVTLTGAAQTVTDSAGAITFSSALTGASTALTATGAGGNFFDSTVKLLSLNAGGAGGTTLGGNVTTTNGQTYMDAVSLSGASITTTDSTGVITFDSTVTGAGTNLTASGAGGNVFDGLVTVKSLRTSGAGGTTLNNDVTTSAGQTYGDAVTLSGATRALTDTAGAITFSSTVNGTSTALSASGAGGNIFDGKVTVLSISTAGAGGTTLGADVTTTAGQTYGDAVSLSGSTQTLSDSVGEIIFSSTLTGTGTALTATGAGGNFFDSTVKLKSLFATGAGGTTLSGNITTSSGQTYADAVTLGGSAVTVTDTTGAITFSSTVTGAGTALTSSGAGGNIFFGLVTAKSLSTGGAGGTTLNNDVTTSAGQTYGDAVTLTGASRTLTDTAGVITFSSTIAGTGTALTSAGVGGNVFDGNVNVKSLLATGAGGTTLAGNITTTAGQTYADAVTLGGSTVSLTDSVGEIIFSSTITGTSTALTASGAGGNFLDGKVTIESLRATGAGGTTLAADVTTSAGQTYVDAVSLSGAARTIADTAGAITFSSTVTGTGTALTASGAGGNFFDDVVHVQSLHTTGAGGTTLGNDVSTTAGQTYGDAVTVTGDQLLVDPSGIIHFTSSLTGPNTALIVSGANGNIFDGPVNLLSLKVIGAGGTTLGGNVTTAHGQTYTDAVTLNGPSITVTDPSGQISFSSTVTGAATDFTVNGAGGNTLNGVVNVQSFTAEGAGGTTLGAGVTTSNGQTYEDSVTLPAGSETLTDTGGAITFQVDLNDPSTDLTVDAFGGEQFSGNVTLRSLTTTASGTATFAGNVTTSAGQTYNNLVDLTSTNQTFSDSAGIIDFENGIFGPQTNLNVFGQGGNIFKGTVTLKSLNVGGAGGTTVIGFVDTTNGQTYGDALTLGPPAGFLIDDTTINIDSHIFGTGRVIAKNIDTHGQQITISTIFFESQTQANLGEFNDSNFSLTTGGRSLELATVIAGAITFVAPPPVITPPALTPSQKADLLLLGIYVKSETDEVILGSPGGGIVIVDWPPIHRPKPGDRKVTTIRLAAQRVKQIVAIFDDVLGPGFANQKQIDDQLTAGIADFRAQLKPTDDKVSSEAFAQFMLSHQDTPTEKALMEKLRALRALVDNINNLGLSSVEAQGANQYWSSSLVPDDSNLVDNGGEYDPNWLLHVLNALPAQAAPPAQ
jgi:filamentous hemagglutinin family protein